MYNPSVQNHLATKVIAKDCLEDWQKVKGTIAEAKILMNMSHQNIVKVKIYFNYLVPSFVSLPYLLRLRACTRIVATTS